MPFMVIYRTSDGVSRYEQSGAIDEAALFVERLRNKDGIDQIRIYRMEEIGFAFRPYYKVELGTPSHSGQHDAPPSPDAVVDGADLPAPEDPEVTPVEPDDALPEVAQTLPPPPAPTPEHAGANGNGRQGLFGR